MLLIEALLRFTEQDKPTMSKLHMAWTLVIQHVEIFVEEAEGRDKEILQEILDKIHARWEYGYCDLQAVAYLLDPEFVHCEMSALDLEAFQSYMRRVFYAHSNVAQDAMIASLTRDLMTFRNSQGPFSSPVAKAAVAEVSATEW